MIRKTVKVMGPCMHAIIDNIYMQKYYFFVVRQCASYKGTRTYNNAQDFFFWGGGEVYSNGFSIVIIASTI